MSVCQSHVISVDDDVIFISITIRFLNCKLGDTSLEEFRGSGCFNFIK